MDCEFKIIKQDKIYCKLAQELSGYDAETTDPACEQCLKCENPKSHNSVTASLAIASSRKHNSPNYKELLETLTPLFKKKVETSDSNIGEGPGTELKKILSWFAVDTPSCSCNDRAKTMNAWGVYGCTKNVDIILDWLQEEATNRKLPFIRLVAKQLVLLAISRAEKCTQNDASSST